jgi:hypothetical protein
MVRGVVGDRNIHPLLGWGILALVLWHGITLVTRLAPDYLCSVCFMANAILAAGLIIGSGLMIGIGFGWAVIGLPLWAFHVWIAGDVLPSSVALHLIGCSVGFVGVRAVPPPRWLVLVALPVGICACLLARFLTHPCYNVNAVFRVQEGGGACSRITECIC